MKNVLVWRILDLPEKANTIEKYAFKGCKNLTKITMPIYVSYLDIDEEDDDEDDYSLKDLYNV